MASVTALLLYRHVNGTDTLGLLYFKHAVAMQSQDYAFAKSMWNDLLSSSPGCTGVMPGIKI
jgi:hypothetical protein